MMKKFIIFIPAIVLLCLLPACSSDDDDVVDEGITIVSSDLLFGASAATGTLVFSSSGSVTVSTDASWCTATVSGSTVTVSVETNASLSGRSASLSLHTSTDDVSVTVQQQGFYFTLSAGSTVTLTDDAHTEAFEMKTNLDSDLFSFSSTSDWISVAIDDDGNLAITVEANELGHPRSGEVSYTTGFLDGVIAVNQYEFSTDIGGNVYLAYTTSATSSSYYGYLGTLAEDGFTFTPATGYEWVIPLDWDEDNLMFTFYGGQIVGTYGSYYVGTEIGGNGYYNRYDTVSADVIYEYDEENEMAFMTFTDNGTFVYGMQYIRFGAYASASTTSTRAGYVLQCYNPAFWRYDSMN